MWYDSKALSFLDPLFVFSAISLRVSSGLSIFLKDFRLDYIRYCAPYRNNVYTSKHVIWSDRFPTFSLRFFLDISLYSSRFFQTLFSFRLDRGNNDTEATFTTFRNLARFQFNFLHSFICFPPPQRLSSRLDSFVAVTRNKRLCTFEMGVSILRRKWSFFAGRRKTRRASSSGAGI